MQETELVGVRCIIAGSRDFTDYEKAKAHLDHLFSKRKPYRVVSGGARGADSLGERYAMDNNIPLKLYPADWGLHGKAAGHIRNREMAMNAEALVAFWDGSSRGTKHMIETAKQMGLKVKVVMV